VKVIYCDDMGRWQYNGVYHSWLEVDHAGFVSALGKDKPSQCGPDTYYITKKYFAHKGSRDLRKTVAILSGKHMDMGFSPRIVGGRGSGGVVNTHQDVWYEPHYAEKNIICTLVTCTFWRGGRWSGYYAALQL
jgi:hypothetical protein